MFLSNLNPEQRESALTSLGSESFDVLVIGGGVNGVGAALDAATRGLKVALISLQEHQADRAS
jgi:glycerol-3-phosphate dehydrogenase